MASLRKKYSTPHLESPRDEDAPVSVPPIAAANLPPEAVADPPEPVETKPLEQPAPDAKSPTDQAAESALRQRLREMEAAEALQRQPQQPQYVSEPQQSRPQEMPPSITTEQIIANAQIPDQAKTWLLAHPDYVSDPIKNAKLVKMHNVAEYQAGGEFTDAYFDRMEVLLGLKPETGNGHDKPTPQPVNVAPRPSAPLRQPVPYVSAPPTREAPSMSTGRPANSRISLTAEETEFAKTCKQTPLESDAEAIRRYAANKRSALDKGLIGPGARDGR